MRRRSTHFSQRAGFHAYAYSSPVSSRETAYSLVKVQWRERAFDACRNHRHRICPVCQVQSVVHIVHNEVGGAPGMFYYYFKSKQDIYLATMEEYISENLERKCSLMEDKEMPFEERRRILSELIATDIKGYADRFSSTGEETISDISYRIYDLIQMLGKLIRPYAAFMLQGIEEGKIQNRLGITVENAEKMSAFILYGIWGLIYNDRFTQTAVGTGPDDMEAILRKLFY